MERSTSVSLGSYFDDFVENKIKALKNAIQEGIDSGIVKDFDPKKHLETLKVGKRKNG
jgi:antitoxin ParD1/3/4